MDGEMAMSDESEMYERIGKLEVGHGRHDERLKSVEDFAREMRLAITGMQVKLAGIVALVTVGIQLAFKFWK
jgi:hypothetical protein